MFPIRTTLFLALLILIMLLASVYPLAFYHAQLLGCIAVLLASTLFADGSRELSLKVGLGIIALGALLSFRFGTPAEAMITAMTSIVCVYAAGRVVDLVVTKRGALVFGVLFFWLPTFVVSLMVEQYSGSELLGFAKWAAGGWVLFCILAALTTIGLNALEDVRFEEDDGYGYTHGPYYHR